MIMQEISELQSFTIEEFQSDFDNLMERIENGEKSLYEASKLASLGLLTATTVHEINNYLSVLLGTLSILKTNCKNICGNQEKFDRLQEVGKRMALFIAELQKIKSKKNLSSQIWEIHGKKNIIQTAKNLIENAKFEIIIIAKLELLEKLFDQIINAKNREINITCISSPISENNYEL